MKKNKIKTLNFLDLNNQTLKNILNFSVYDVDKVIINCKNFEIEELQQKILSLYNVLFKLSQLRYNNEYDLFRYKPSNKDEEFWINCEIKYGEINIIYNTEGIMDIINLLDDCISNEENMLYDFIENKIQKIIGYQKRIIRGYAYFNINLKIEENIID